MLSLQVIRRVRTCHLHAFSRCFSVQAPLPPEAKEACKVSVCKDTEGHVICSPWKTLLQHQRGTPYTGVLVYRITMQYIILHPVVGVQINQHGF